METSLSYSQSSRAALPTTGALATWPPWRDSRSTTSRRSLPLSGNSSASRDSSHIHPEQIGVSSRPRHSVPQGPSIGLGTAATRILGIFRKGGGDVQEASGRRVLTLKMTAAARLFVALMAMAMMTIAMAVVLHFVVAGSVDRGSQATIEQWLITLEAVRRIGVAIYLVALALGLGAIITVLGFQTIRVRQLPNETTGQSQGVAHQHMGHCLYPVGVSSRSSVEPATMSWSRRF